MMLLRRFATVPRLGYAYRRFCAANTSVSDLTGPECVFSLMQLQETLSLKDQGRIVKLSSSNKLHSEVIEKVEQACKCREQLRPDQLANLLILVSDVFMYHNEEVARQLTEHTVANLHHFAVEDVVLLCQSAMNHVLFSEIVRLAALHALDRIEEMDEPSSELACLWDCAVRKELHLQEVLNAVTELLVDRSVELDADQLTEYVTSCADLPPELRPQYLNKLAPVVITNLDDSTPISTICEIAHMYGTALGTVNKAFWQLIVPRLTAVRLMEAEPSAVVSAAIGLASCQHLERIEKALCLKQIANSVVPRIGRFGLDEMSQLLEAFVKANCTHKQLFELIRKNLKLQSPYRNTVLHTPKLLFSLTRLKAPCKDLVRSCLTQLNDSRITKLPAHNLPLLLYAMAKNNFRAKNCPKDFLPVLAEHIMSTSKKIPRDDFKLIVGCLDKIGYTTRTFDMHKVDRLGSDAATAISLMGKWTEHDDWLELKRMNDLLLEDRAHRAHVRESKKLVNREVDMKAEIGMLHAITNAETFGSQQQTQDVRDSDFINIWHRDDEHGVADALRHPYFTRLHKKHRPNPTGSENPLPNDNLEPAFVGRIQYDTTCNTPSGKET